MDVEFLIGIFPQVLLDGIILGFMYALIALGYTMVSGVLEFINFAHSEIFIVGEVNELEDAVHHRVAQRDQGVHEAEDDAVEQNLREDADQKFDVQDRKSTRLNSS